MTINITGHSGDLRPSADQIVAFMRSVSLLSEVGEQVLREAETFATWKVLPSRETLFAQGQSNRFVYLVFSGKLRFERRDEQGKLIASGYTGPGELVGEISALYDDRAVTTTYAVRNSHLMVITTDTFKDLLLRSPTTLLSVAKLAFGQVDRGISGALVPVRHESIALLPLDPTVPMLDFSELLKTELAKYGRVGCVTRDLVENQLGSGRADLRVGERGFSENSAWFARYVRDHDTVLWVADHAASSWSRQCLSEADRILFVGRSDGPREPTLAESELCGSLRDFAPPCDLVLLHQDSGLPQNTAEHLAHRDVDRHHQIWLQQREGLERLARVLTGHSIGLVLGGGGIRAAAHIGLIQAFQENGIPIDHVGGTSIGALVGALLASGMSTSEMLRVITDQVVNKNLFNDYTLPLLSLSRGRKFTGFLQNILGNVRIEDLPIDFFATATNLTKSKLELQLDGPLWAAVRASASLPAILPPMLKYGQLYLDGGLLDNTPARSMRAQGAGRVIAVDVSAGDQSSGDIDLQHMMSSQGVGPSIIDFFRRKVFKSRAPTIADIVVRSMVIGSREQAEKSKALADLYIRMPVDPWKMLDFKATPALVRLGYDYAVENMPEWQNKILPRATLKN